MGYLRRKLNYDKLLSSALPFLNESRMNPCESTTGTLKPLSLGFNSPTRSRGSKVIPEKTTKKSVVSRALRGSKWKVFVFWKKRSFQKWMFRLPFFDSWCVGSRFLFKSKMVVWSEWNFNALTDIAWSPRRHPSIQNTKAISLHWGRGGEP